MKQLLLLTLLASINIITQGYASTGTLEDEQSRGGNFLSGIGEGPLLYLSQYLTSEERKGLAETCKAVQRESIKWAPEVVRIRDTELTSERVAELNTKGREIRLRLFITLNMSKDGPLSPEITINAIRMLTQFKKLEALNIDECQIVLPTPVIEALAAALSSLSKLQRLKLAGISPKKAEIEALATALTPVTQQLRELNLERNYLSSAGTKIIAGLRVSSYLQVLNLSKTGLTTEGITTLFDVLLELKELQYLNLLGNSIGKVGTKLAEALQPLSHLQVLILEDTDLDVKEIRPLTPVLLEKLELKQVDIHQRPSYPTVETAIAELRAALPPNVIIN